MPDLRLGRSEPSACTWLERLERRDVSSVELTEHVLERLDGVRSLNAVVSSDPETALLQARRADRDRAAGADGALLGLPVTVKDSLGAVGLPSLSGSLARIGHSVERDATVVRRLREAGAIVVAKTNVPEYTWSYETDNIVSGRTVHPLDPARTPGGSSGGEAALLGADASVVGIGTDGGGSIRVPSHYCGIVGLRPTAGLVPETGCWPTTRDTGMLDMNAVGPMARYVADAELLLPVLAGPDGVDPFVGQAALAEPGIADTPLRVGFYLDDGVATPDAATRDAVVSAARALEHAGCLVDQVEPPDVSHATEIFFGMMAADGGARARMDLADAGGRHTRQMTSLLDDLAGQALDTVGYFSLFRRWAALRAIIRAFVAAYDVVLAPVTVGAAPLHGCTPGTETTLESYDVFNYTHAFSIAGLPVAVLPVAAVADLPLGVQVVANPFHDRVALAAAALLEASRPALTSDDDVPSRARG
jgi:Asp-tRNA(Asn)/Glu-tRNA(Gln) amidotransferase A subunit family amidase